MWHFNDKSSGADKNNEQDMCVAGRGNESF